MVCSVLTVVSSDRFSWQLTVRKTAGLALFLVDPELEFGRLNRQALRVLLERLEPLLPVLALLH